MKTTYVSIYFTSTSVVFTEDIPALFVVFMVVTYDKYYIHNRMQYIKF
jgi:hypothetical protein